MTDLIASNTQSAWRLGTTDDTTTGYSRSRDGVGLVEVLDGLLQRLAGDLRLSGASSEGLQAGEGDIRGRRLGRIIAEERRRDLPHAVTEAEDVVVGEWRAHDLGERTADGDETTG